jgi:selenocysteine lyase/cysteine desulfurase
MKPPISHSLLPLIALPPEVDSYRSQNRRWNATKHPGDRFLLTFDNHNSVNGIREFARARGTETTYVPSETSDLRVDEQLLPRYLIDLDRWQPDFVALSFYKMFGWPSGVGCLLARGEALAKLERPGSPAARLFAAFVQREWYAPARPHFRGRHRQLPQPARSRDRPAPARSNRN